METLPNDNQVIDLLAKLKKSEAVYPAEIFAARRQDYLKQLSNLGLGTGASAGIKNTLKGGSSTVASATVTGKVLETVLAAALLLETGTVAYLYRDKIADIVKTYITPAKTQVATPAPDRTSSQSSESIEITETPTVTTTVISLSNTPLATPSNTPSPEITGGSNKDSGANPSANSTPSPKENNGNHYGQTPKPERTKDNNGGGNGNGNGGGNNDHGGGNGNGNGNKNKP